MQTIQRKDIIIPERLRKDHGNIEELAESVNRLGLIQPVVLNRAQKDDADGSYHEYTLMAGGRRTKALDLLGIEEWTHGIHYVFKDEISDDLALEIELEENVQRMDMTWQERVLSIAKIHSLKVKKSAEEGKDWGHEETGSILGMRKSNVGVSIQVAKQLQAGNEFVAGAENFRDAINRLMKQKEDQGLALIAKSMVQPASPVQSDLSEPTEQEPEYEFEEDHGTAEEVLAELEAKAPVQTIHISRMLHNCDVLDWLKLQPDNSLKAHCLTDPPYAIEMSHLTTKNIVNVEATHDKQDNLRLLRAFIPEWFRVQQDKHFTVLFCDAEHFDELCALGVAAGFKVTRWPIVWVKSHHCQNNNAQYNFTKATEDAVVFRKGEAYLAKPPQQNWWLGDNVDVRKKHPDHPFVKPAGLWTWIATHIALPGQTIFDPFMGEASCGEAVLPFRYNYIGVELDPIHYNKALVSVCEHYHNIFHGKVRFE